jgi:hypothetical protein
LLFFLKEVKGLNSNFGNCFLGDNNEVNDIVFWFELESLLFIFVLLFNFFTLLIDSFFNKFEKFDFDILIFSSENVLKCIIFLLFTKEIFLIGLKYSLSFLNINCFFPLFSFSLSFWLT